MTQRTRWRSPRRAAPGPCRAARGARRPGIGRSSAWSRVLDVDRVPLAAERPGEGLGQVPVAPPVRGPRHRRRDREADAEADRSTLSADPQRAAAPSRELDVAALGRRDRVGEGLERGHRSLVEEHRARHGDDAPAGAADAVAELDHRAVQVADLPQAAEEPGSGRGARRWPRRSPRRRRARAPWGRGHRRRRGLDLGQLVVVDDVVAQRSHAQVVGGGPPRGPARVHEHRHRGGDVVAVDRRDQALEPVLVERVGGRPDDRDDLALGMGDRVVDGCCVGLVAGPHHPAVEAPWWEEAGVQQEERGVDRRHVGGGHRGLGTVGDDDQRAAPGQGRGFRQAGDRVGELGPAELEAGSDRDRGGAEGGHRRGVAGLVGRGRGRSCGAGAPGGPATARPAPSGGRARPAGAG